MQNHGMVNEAAVWIDIIEYCSKARSAKEASRVPLPSRIIETHEFGLQIDLDLESIEDWLSIQPEISKDLKKYPQGVSDEERFGHTSAAIDHITGLLLGMAGCQVERDLSDSNLTVRRKVFYSQLIKNARNLFERKGLFADGGPCAHIHGLAIRRDTTGTDGQQMIEQIPWFRYLFKSPTDLEPEQRSSMLDEFSTRVLDVIQDVYVPALATICPEGELSEAQTLQGVKHAVNVVVWKRLYKSQWLEYQTECHNKAPTPAEVPPMRMTLPMAWLCWDSFGPLGDKVIRDSIFCVYSPDSPLDEMKSSSKRASSSWKRPAMPGSAKRMRMSGVGTLKADSEMLLSTNAKVIDLTSTLYKVPLDEVLTDARHGDHTHFELVVVKITTADGAEGIGYTYTGGNGGRSIRCMIMNDLRKVLLGQDSSPIESLYSKLQSSIHYVGRGGIASFAISAIDIALWDLKCKRLGLPLWRVLGGTSSHVRCYRGAIDLGLTQQQLCASVRHHLDQGHNAVKIKLGRPSLAEDIARVAAVRKEIGPDTTLMVDANFSYSVATAIAAAKRLAEHDVLWLEEPTSPDDFDGTARVQQEGGLAVAGGENLHTLFEFAHAIKANALAYPQPDASNIGGVTGWLKVATLCEANNLPVSSHGMQELHVSLLAGVSNAGWMEVHSFPIDRYTMAGPVEVKNGFAIAPDHAIGIGVSFNWEKLAQYTEDKWEQ